MGYRAHRVKQIIYAENNLFKVGSTLSELILNHNEVIDMRQEGCGTIELPFSCLIEIRENETLPEEEREILDEEINELESLNTDKEEYLQYDIF